MLIDRFTRVKDRHVRELKSRRRLGDFGFWASGHGFRKEPSSVLEPYSLEDELLDQLAKLPSPELVQLLIDQLRNPELKELATGVINDVANASKKADNLGVIKAINGWIATAEEPISSRRKIRHVLAAREQGRSFRQTTP